MHGKKQITLKAGIEQLIKVFLSCASVVVVEADTSSAAHDAQANILSRCFFTVSPEKCAMPKLMKHHKLAISLTSFSPIAFVDRNVVWPEAVVVALSCDSVLIDLLDYRTYFFSCQVYGNTSGLCFFFESLEVDPQILINIWIADFFNYWFIYGSRIFQCF